MIARKTRVQDSPCHEAYMLTIFFRVIVRILTPLSLLSACTAMSPEAKLRAGLAEAGLSPHLAGCMAERMADRLSIPQLRQLQSLASLRKADPGGMTIDSLLHKVRALDDPEIFVVTSKAAIGCML